MQVTETLNEGLKRGYNITVSAAELDEKVNEKLAEAQPDMIQFIRTVIAAHGSTYQRRGLASSENRERHDARIATAAGSMAAQAIRLGNQRVIPLLTAARSLSWLMTMAHKTQTDL